MIHIFVLEEFTMEQKFIEELTETIDTEETLAMDTVLEDLEDWDSLSFVSFISMANTSYNKKVSAEQVREAVTVADLYALVKG